MSERQRVDVLVVGAGPAGVAAAVTAAEAGASVLLLDENARPGGQVWRHDGAGGPPPAARGWLERLRRARVTTWSETTVLDGAPGYVVVERAGRVVTVEASSMVLATGARERVLPFPGWTLPGVVGVGALQALLKSGLEVRGQRVVLAGSGPLLLPVAALLVERGACLTTLAEQAELSELRRFALGLWRWPEKLIEATGYRWRTRDVPFRTGTWVAAAGGEGRLEEVELTDGASRWTERCDWLGTAQGLVPSLELPMLLGCATSGGVVDVDEALTTSRAGVHAVGELLGIGGVSWALVTGRVAGAAAVGRDVEPALRRKLRRQRRFVELLGSSFGVRDELLERMGDDTVVCRCEDVPWSALRGRRSARDAKLHERVGMGPCQGRVCGPALELLAGFGPPRVQPPLVPVRAAVLEEGWGGDA
ncbi:MAG: FAD-dependent oxidoreductase [Acidobacteriota bacterium]